MNRKTLVRCISSLFLSGACLAPGLVVPTAFAAPDKDAGKPAEITSIKGMCTFNGKEVGGHRSGSMTAEMPK